MTSLASPVPAKPGGLRRWVYGPSGLRAGWRLVLFLAMVLALDAARGLLIGTLLHGNDEIVQYLANKVLRFLAFLLATWGMARLEGRRIADYGLPWRRMFRRRFWQGIAIGLVLITALLVALRTLGAFRFGSIVLHGAEVWAYAGFYALAFVLIGLEEEFRYRGYVLRTLASGIGFWPAAAATVAFFGYSHFGNGNETWVVPSARRGAGYAHSSSG